MFKEEYEKIKDVFVMIVDLKTLNLLYKAQKRKVYRKDIIKFRNNFDVNISLLREELLLVNINLLSTGNLL